MKEIMYLAYSYLAHIEVELLGEKLVDELER